MGHHGGTGDRGAGLGLALPPALPSPGADHARLGRQRGREPPCRRPHLADGADGPALGRRRGAAGAVHDPSDPPGGAGARADLAPHLVMGGLGFTAFNAPAAYHTTAVNIAILRRGPGLRADLRARRLRHAHRPPAGARHGADARRRRRDRGPRRPSGARELRLPRRRRVHADRLRLYAVYTLALRDRPKVSGFVFFSVLALAALMISLPLLAWEIAAGEVIWPDLR